MQYKTKRIFEFLTQPNADANKSGQSIAAGVEFDSNEVINGWIKYADKRWIIQSACDEVTQPPPPPDPDPVETFSPPVEIMARWLLSDGTYTDYYTYRIAP